VILNIADIKKLHANLMKRIQQQTGQKTSVKSFEVEERIYLRTDNL